MTGTERELADLGGDTGPADASASPAGGDGHEPRGGAGSPVEYQREEPYGEQYVAPYGKDPS